MPKHSAICVQRFDDSRNSAIHITYRISLRSSSLREPRDPLSKVVFDFIKKTSQSNKKQWFQMAGPLFPKGSSDPKNIFFAQSVKKFSR